MEIIEAEGGYMIGGVSYTPAEERAAVEIRKLSDGEEKEFLTKCFEVETGKPFPCESGIYFEFNPSVALLDSRKIDAACRFIFENPRLVRKHLSLN